METFAEINSKANVVYAKDLKQNTYVKEKEES